MLKFLKKIGHKYSIKEVEINLVRTDLIRRSRILFIDDEVPELIDDLKKSGFSVNHEYDITPDNCKLIEPQNYDLILLDFGNVGSKFGKDEGLSLLQHIKRVNPIVVIISYTSKSIPSTQSEFYTKSDFNLSKDAGIADSMAKIEEGLIKAHSIERMWDSFLMLMGVPKNSGKDFELQNEYVKALKSDNKREVFKKKISGMSNAEISSEVLMWLLGKLIEIGIKGIITIF